MDRTPYLHDRDIVCVGFADWDTDLWTNQHHLMSRLARENRVLFVESLGLRRPQLAGRDLRRILRRVRTGLRGPRVADGLHVLSPLVLPLHSNRVARSINARLLPALVARAARRLSLSKPILWAYVPQAEALLDALDPELVVYHCVDDVAAQPGIDGESYRAAERRFAARADLVLASAPALAKRMRTLSDNVLYAPNVADTDLFATALQDGPLDPAMAALPAPRIVFTGAIVTTKLDLDLIVALARARREWSICLVGPVGPGDPRADVSALRAERNVHLLGARSYEQLPAVLRAAGAGIVPYARNSLTESIFPMKVYEYLAAGLPVVATELPALAGIAEVAVAPSAEQMAQAIESALAEDSPQRRQSRSSAAAAHSWERRLSEIAAAIDPLPGAGASARRPAFGRAPGGDENGHWDLFVTTHTPALGTGRAVRTYGVVRALAAHRLVRVLYIPFGAQQPDRAFVEIAGVQLQPVASSRRARRALAFVRARLSGVPHDFARGISPELRAAAARLAADPDCARVVADGPVAAATLAELAGRRPVLYNAHNLESAFRHELDSGGGLRGLRAFESQLLERCAESWMVSEADLRAARELCPSARLRLVPNVVDVAAIEPVFAPERKPVTPAAQAPTGSDPAAGEPRVLFAANFAYEPNRNALRFLLEQAMPLVWERLPRARLTLVGGGLSDPPTDPRVEALGFVPDLTPVYRSADCAVVPLLQGGGTSLKLVEALAYGLPAVVTPRAAAALGLHDRVDCLVGEGDQAFAAAIVQALDGQAAAIARAGRRVAESRYSIKSLAETLRP
ncbi:MAG TPA: glycosyltransferase [Solirubrobacteraceae bacterium]|jgi:glycosyltransferase involved in cell wall biosynthesis|nr:glycosyltransferase [Solirubrobacteraceae bacterium]